MNSYILKWPDDFEGYAWLLESKGWFSGLEIIVEGKTVRPIFYDPARLSQEIPGEISRAGFFSEPRLIVVSKVTRETMEGVIAELARTGELERLA